MTTLRQQMAADLAEIHGDSAFSPAETVTWYPVSGAAFTTGVTVVFQSDGRGRAPGDTGERQTEAGRVFVEVAQMASVSIGDQIERTGQSGGLERWAVLEIAFESPVLRKLVVQKSTLSRFLGAADRVSVGKAQPL